MIWGVNEKRRGTKELVGWAEEKKGSNNSLPLLSLSGSGELRKKDEDLHSSCASTYRSLGASEEAGEEERHRAEYLPALLLASLGKTSDRLFLRRLRSICAAVSLSSSRGVGMGV